MAYSTNRNDSDSADTAAIRKAQKQKQENSSLAASIAPIIVGLGFLLYNGYVYYGKYTDSGALHEAKSMINDGLEEDKADYRLEDLKLIRKGTYEDAVRVFSGGKYGNEITRNGTFFETKGTYSDGEEAYVCIYRYSSGKHTYILTGGCD